MSKNYIQKRDYILNGWKNQRLKKHKLMQSEWEK